MPKLKDLSVTFLSLVKTPATGKGLTLKSAKPGDRVQAFEIIKTDDELMRAYGIVYAPDQEDAHGDTADAATIRKAAAEFMREGRLQNIDTEHSFTTEMAFVAESWLVKSGDPMFPEEPEGAWAVGIQIGDPDIWKRLKSGDLTGISLAGIARAEPNPNDRDPARYTEKDAAPKWFTTWLKALTGTPNQDPIEETEMDKNEVQEIVRDTLKSELADAIKTALKAPEEPEKTEVEKAVEAALKKAGIEPKAKAKGDDTDETGDETPITKGELKTLLGDEIAKALAKGETETGGTSDKNEESFL